MHGCCNLVRTHSPPNGSDYTRRGGRLEREVVECERQLAAREERRTALFRSEMLHPRRPRLTIPKTPSRGSLIDLALVTGRIREK